MHIDHFIRVFEQEKENDDLLGFIINGFMESLTKKGFAKKLTKEEVNKAYIKIQKKIHPDVSPETSRLSSLVNEAKEIVLRDLG